ncbi:MAG: response regulator [Chlorobi bacterium]|nr:response regulator [Chlorobiota bacterium]
MKVVIIDDSRLARNELKRLLSNKSSIEIIGEAANSEEAKTIIENKKPDVIFLDIQMPGKSGFDLLEELEFVPKVIFTTAYDQYALKAFEVNAFDYLLKPIDKERLAEALMKVADVEPQINEAEESYITERFFIKDGYKCWFVKLNDIKYFEVYGNYSKVCFENESPMIPRTLNYLEKRLNPAMFFRANRKQIININWIQKIEPWFNGALKVALKDQTEISVSRRQAGKLKELLSF